MTKSEQAFLSFAIRIIVIGAIAILDYISKSLGGWNLPDATVTVPLLGLIVSEADTWLINWESANPPTTP